MPDSPSLETFFVRLYLDRHIMARLAVDLRAQGFDVLKSEERAARPRTSLAEWAEANAENWGDRLSSEDVEGFTGRRF